MVPLASNPKPQLRRKGLSHASLYHLVHTAALVTAPVTKQPNILGELLSTGNLPFSGTGYAMVYLEDRKYSRLAPFGGFAFIAAFNLQS